MKMMDMKDEAIKKYISAMNSIERSSIRSTLSELSKELNVDEQTIVVQIIGISSVQNDILACSNDESVLDVFEEAINTTLSYVKKHGIV